MSSKVDYTRKNYGFFIRVYCSGKMICAYHNGAIVTDFEKLPDGLVYQAADILELVIKKDGDIFRVYDMQEVELLSTDERKKRNHFILNHVKRG